MEGLREGRRDDLPGEEEEQGVEAGLEGGFLSTMLLSTRARRVIPSRVELGPRGRRLTVEGGRELVSL